MSNNQLSWRCINAPQDLGVNLVPDNPAHVPNHVLILCTYVKGFTPLCLTWAALMVTDLSCLHSGVHQRCGPTRCEIERVGMNLVVIEEHQVGDLVFAQLYYLYTPLRPHRPMLSYQSLKYCEPSTVAISIRIVRKPRKHQQTQATWPTQ